MKWFLVLLMAFLAACQTTPKNPEFWMEKEVNACLPTAIVFRQSLRKYDVWAEVFKYSWIGKNDNMLHGHAMVAYLYPQGNNQLWTYDAKGSYRTRAFTNSVYQVAQEAHKTRGGTEKVFLTEYIK